MSASPQTVDTAPLFLTSNTNVHNARDFRRQFSDVVGQGVADQDSFRIRQRAAGATMSVDCMTASIPNRAYVRGITTVDAGMYRIYFNSATQINLDIAAADATNPRIDQVFLCVEDSQETGSNNLATVRVVTGTPTPGATLDNRSGIGATPTGMSSFLLADILVAAAAGSIVNANIRDRRPFGVRGAIPSTYTARDLVAFEPVAFASSNINIQTTASADAQQAAALMWLPRRIVLATKLKFKASQGATANLNNSGFGIYDASGRQIVLTTPAAIGGTASQQVSVDLTITATTFEVGYYWIWNGQAAGTASATMQAYAVVGSNVGTFLTGPNQYAYATSGGTTAPTTILSMVDLWTITGAAVVTRLGVPVPALSVG
jgi:hypothetical protein